MAAPNVSPGPPAVTDTEMEKAGAKSPAAPKERAGHWERHYTQQSDFIANQVAHPGPGVHDTSPGAADEMAHYETVSTERSDSKRRTVGSVSLAHTTEPRDPRAPRPRPTKAKEGEH